MFFHSKILLVARKTTTPAAPLLSLLKQNVSFPDLPPSPLSQLLLPCSRSISRTCRSMRGRERSSVSRSRHARLVISHKVCYLFLLLTLWTRKATHGTTEQSKSSQTSMTNLRLGVVLVPPTFQLNERIGLISSLMKIEDVSRCSLLF